MTGQELVDAVKGNLGSRTSGYIGERPVDTVVLEALNKGIEKILQRYRPQGTKESLTLSLTSAAYLYALPSSSTSGWTIKEIIRARLLASGDTSGTLLDQIPVGMKDEMSPIMDSSRVGRPRYYNWWSGSLEFYPWPDGAYTAYFRCNMWPAAITVNSAATALGIQTDTCVEAYATYWCFSKLQQTMDAAMWKKIFTQELRELKASMNRQPNQILDARILDIGLRETGVEPGLDPFVRSVQ